MKPVVLILLALVPLGFANGEQWPIDENVVLLDATIANVSIKITASERRFDPDKHKITNSGKEPPTIDGLPIIGTDQTIPPKGFPQLDRLTVAFNDKKVEVPQKLLHRVFSAHLSHDQTSFDSDFASTVISVSSDAKTVIVDLGVGDGGGSSNTVFLITSSGTVTTEHPARPGE